MEDSPPVSSNPLTDSPITQSTPLVAVTATPTNPVPVKPPEVQTSAPVSEVIPLPPAIPMPTRRVFAGWNECGKALDLITPQSTLQEKEFFLASLKASELKKLFAFEVLCLLQDGKSLPKWGWLTQHMLDELGSGDPEPNLSKLPSPKDAGKWVYKQFDDTLSPEAWDRMVGNGRFLWILFAIIQAATSKLHLIESIAALAQCVNQCQRSSSGRRTGKERRSPDDPIWIAELIKEQVTTKAGLSKQFIGILYSLNATATLASEVRDEIDQVEKRLETTESRLSVTEMARREAENQIDRLKAELEIAISKLASANHLIEQEKIHAIRLGGFNAVAREEAVTKVLATVRQGVLHRLENIRIYADRENPDREEIVALVGEIESHLARVQQMI
jgi:hypothetical protein